MGRKDWISLLCIYLLFLPISGYGRTIKVREGKSIQDAISAASKGDMIEVLTGTYKEHIVVDKKIQLVGIGMPVVDGGGKGRIVDVRSPGAVIKGLRISGSGNDLAAIDAGIFVERGAKGVVIRDNILEDCLFCIWVDGAEGVKTISNQITGKKELISQRRGNGIHYWNVIGGLIERNHIRQTRDGVYIFENHDTVIRANEISDLRYGIHYMYADRNTVVGNIVSRCRKGFALMFSEKLNVFSNIALDNSEDGILFRDLRSSRVANNVVTGNGRQGLFIYNSTYNEIDGNLFIRNKIGAYLWAGSVNNKVVGNTFIRNSEQVKYVGMVDEVWNGNYWSDYLGWDLDGDGKGDIPYRANDIMGRLSWEYPVVKLLISSPAVHTLRMIENQFPVMSAPSIVDRSPLMAPRGDEWRKWIGRTAYKD